MENFFLDENFYSDLYDMCASLDWDTETINTFPDDFTVTVNYSVLEPIVNLSPDWIIENISDERFPEDDEKYYDKLYKILKEHIDFEKINKLIPELYYSTRKKHTFTKADLLETVDF